MCMSLRALLGVTLLAFFGLDVAVVKMDELSVDSHLIQIYLTVDLVTLDDFSVSLISLFLFCKPNDYLLQLY